MTERARYFENAVTIEGVSIRIVPYAEITVYYADSEDLFIDPIYDSLSGIGTLPNPFITDQYGNILFYIDTPQRLKLVVSGTGLGTFEIDNEGAWPDPGDLLYTGTLDPTFIGLTIDGTDDIERFHIEDDFAAFFSDLFYFDFVTNRVGLKNTNPEYDFDVTGNIRAQSTGLVDPTIVAQATDLEGTALAIKSQNGLSNIFEGGYDASKEVFTFRLDDGSYIVIGYDGSATNGIHYKDSLNATLFKVTGTTITTRNIVPLVDMTYVIGNASTRPLITYTAFLLVGGQVGAPVVGGSLAQPIITPRRNSATGWHFPSDSEIVSGLYDGVSSSVKSMRQYLDGIEILKSAYLGHLATIATPQTGYLGISPKSNNHIYTKDTSTVVRQVEDSSLQRFRNRLKNGDARVCQRTTMPVTDNSYAIDAMKLLMESATGWTISQETSNTPSGGSPCGFKFTVGATNNAKGGGFWPVTFPNMADIRSGECSIQFKGIISDARIGDIRVGLIQRTSGTVDTFADPVSAWGAAGTNPTLTDGWAFVNTPTNVNLTTSWSIAVKVEGQTISASANALGILIWCDDKTTTTGDFFIVTDLQLERNDVCREVERPDYDEQLVRCEAWLQVFGGTQFAIQCFGANSDTVTAEFGPLLKRPMRKAPTSTTVTLADWSVFQQAAQISSFAGGSLSILHTSPTGVWFRGIIAVASLTTNAGVFLANTLSATSKLVISGEP